MKIRYQSRDLRGDTIVEVMLVLAILGLAIGISYATANQSLLNTRQAQENSIATEYVQSQVEALRTLTSVGNTGSQNIFTPGPYCIDTSTTPTYTVKPITDPACVKESLYNISISGPPALPGGTFTVTATWPDVEGQGNDTVTDLYNLYQTP